MSEYASKTILKHVFNQATLTPPTFYVALYTTAPYVSDTSYGTEVTGGSYARKLLGTMATYTAGSYKLVTSADVAFPSMPAVPALCGVAILDASTAGNMWFFEDYTAAPLVVNAGDRVLIAAGNLSVTLAA